MVYDITTRLNRLGNRMKELNDNSLTYTRGPTVITITNVTMAGISNSMMAIFGPALLEEEMQDFIFDAADIASLGEPAEGDFITFNSQRYDVISMEDDTDTRELFRYTTASRLRIRIHTKRG